MLPNPFAGIKVLGDMSPDEVAKYLHEVGDNRAAYAVDAAEKREPSTYTSGVPWGGIFDLLCYSKAHSFGFLPATGNATNEIMGIGRIPVDSTLKNTRIKITLNYLRVADYPGIGTHNILIDFYARNQVSGQTEDLHFNATYRVPEGESTPIVGYPIFVGLNVGSEGVAFRCMTVNVENDTDKTFLKFLEGDVFKAGLKLATVAQPAIAPLSNLALGLTKSFLDSSTKNKTIQEFYLGLDFAGTKMGARLAIGDYIAVQIPEKFERIWNWKDWVFDPDSGRIVARDNPEKLIPYNYLVFGVSRYEGD